MKQLRNRLAALVVLAVLFASSASATTKTAVAARNTAIDAVTALANSGKLRIYSGTQPTDADTALSGNTLLAELVMNATAFAAASSGSASANAITSDSSADATGTATFFRLFKSDGTTVIMDGAVGTSGAQLNLNTTSIVTAAAVSVTSFTISQAP
jgi:hypothetical protein